MYPLEPFTEGGGSASSNAGPVGPGAPVDRFWTAPDMGDDDCGEVSGMKARPQPRKPTDAEIAAHNVDHYPYRSWCRSCVSAEGRSDRHERTEGDADAVPVIAMDYGFFSDSADRQLALERAGVETVPSVERSGAEQTGKVATSSSTLSTSTSTSTPILVMKDSSTKMIFGDVVRCKGAQDPYSVQLAVKHIE